MLGGASSTARRSSAPGGYRKVDDGASIANRIASGPDRDVVYATGEETIEDIALRADRLGATAARLRIVAETSLERILDLRGARCRRYSSWTRSR